MPVDGAWIDAQVAEWSRLTRDGYRVPAIAQHNPEATQGSRLGDVLDVRRVMLGGKAAMTAAIAWAMPGAQELLDSGGLRYVSPHFGPLADDGNGGAFDLVLLEVSAVTAPHQKHLGRTHILAGEYQEVPMDGIAPAAPAAPTADDRLSALEALVQGLAEKMEALAAPPAMAEEEPAEADESADEPDGDDIVMGEIRALRSELAAEKKARREAEFSARYPAGAVVELTPELREVCFQLAEADADAFQALAANAKRPAITHANTQTPPRAASIQWGVALGEGAAPLPDVDGKSLYTRCLSETSGDAVKALDLFEQRTTGGRN